MTFDISHTSLAGMFFEKWKDLLLKSLLRYDDDEEEEDDEDDDDEKCPAGKSYPIG